MDQILPYCKSEFSSVEWKSVFNTKRCFCFRGCGRLAGWDRRADNRVSGCGRRHAPGTAWTGKLSFWKGFVFPKVYQTAVIIFPHFR